MAIDLPGKLNPLVDHGFEPTGTTGSEVYGHCPFCGKEKFYVNKESGQWECKAGKCSKNGNVTTFLDQIIDHYSPLKKPLLKRLIEVRGLPKWVLKRYDIGYDGTRYLLPVRWSTGHVQDIGTYIVGHKIKSTKGVGNLRGTGLLNIEKLKDTPKDIPVYVCAGYWDTLAMEAMLKEGKHKGIVVGAPGEQTFKKEWIEYFQGRKVYLCYDSDEAGDKGTAKVGGCNGFPKPSSKLSEGMLRGVASELSYLCWPMSLESKVDLNDFYRKKGTYKKLAKLFRPSHRRDSKPKKTKKDKRKKLKLAKLDFPAVLQAYESRLKMTDGMTRGLRLIYATVASIRFASDPVWLYLVAPSGGGKTVLLSSLRGSQHVIYRSSLSKATLVSGMRGTNDPSLIPELNEKCFVLKDFTEVLQMNDMDREEVVGTLRGIYDGYLDKSYGTGVHRHYESLFSIVAGVTPSIHKYTDKGVALGDRFLKFDMTRGEPAVTQKVGEPDPILMAAMEGLEVEQVEDESLVAVSTAFCSKLSNKADKRKRKFKTPHDIKVRIAYLGEFIALLRTSIERNYQGELECRPLTEKPSRMVKQLSKLTWGLALIDGKSQPDEECYREVRDVALDTAFGMRRDIMDYLLKRDKKGATVDKLVGKVKLPTSTLRDKLNDLELLGIADREKLDRPIDPTNPRHHLGGAKRELWRASKKMRSLWSLV